MKPFDLSQYMFTLSQAAGAGDIGFDSNLAYAAGTVGNALKNAGAGGTGGIPDAPVDGHYYSRKNAAWVQTSIGFVQKTGDVMTGPLTVSDNYVADFTMQAAGIKYTLNMDSNSGSPIITYAADALVNNVNFTFGGNQKFYIDSQGTASVNFAPALNTSSRLQVGGDISIVGGGDNGSQNLMMNMYWSSAASSFISQWKGYGGVFEFDSSTGNFIFSTSTAAATASEANLTINPVFKIDNAGNLGVNGSLTFGSELESLYQAAPGSVILRVGTGGSQSQFGFLSNGTNPMLNAPSGTLTFGTNGVEVARLTTVGNLGVGNTNPDSFNGAAYRGLFEKDQDAATRLCVANMHSSANARASFLIQGATTNSNYNTILIDNSGAPFVSHALGSSVLYENWTAPNEIMRLTAAGNLGVGNTNPDSFNGSVYRGLFEQDQDAPTRLAVANVHSSVNARATVSLIGANTNSYFNTTLQDNNGSPSLLNSFGTSVGFMTWQQGAIELMRLVKDGSFGINYIPPGNTYEKLLVGGDIALVKAGSATKNVFNFNIFNTGTGSNSIVNAGYGASINFDYSVGNFAIQTGTVNGAVGTAPSLSNGMVIDNTQKVSMYNNLTVGRAQDAPTVVYVQNTNITTNAASVVQLATGTANSYWNVLLGDSAGHPYAQHAFGSAVSLLSWSFSSSEKMRLNSDGTLGVGMVPITSTTNRIHSFGDIGLYSGDNGAQALSFNAYWSTTASGYYTYAKGYGATIRLDANAGAVTFNVSTATSTAANQATSLSEVMRINHNGSVGITSAATAAKLNIATGDGGIGLGISGVTKGLRLIPMSGAFSIEGVDNTLNGSYQPLSLNGSIVNFVTAGTAVGSIASNIFTQNFDQSAHYFFTSTGGIGFRILNTSSGSTLGRFVQQATNNAFAGVVGIGFTYDPVNSCIRPETDGSLYLGIASTRWAQIYSTIGTISTSDAREKDWRGDLTKQELAAASDLVKEVGVYRWLAAIKDKGDDARMHIGLLAQQVRKIMKRHKLDAAKYGFFCYDKWDEYPTMGEDGKDYMAPAGDRYSVRYDELTLFMLAAQEQRLQRLEKLLETE